MAAPLRPDNRPGMLGPGPVRPVPVRRPVGRGGAGSPANPDPLTALLAGYPQPVSDSALSAQAHGMVDPLIQQITDSINARAKAGAGAISGYSGELAKGLSGFADSAKNIYGNAEQSQAATDAALADRLSGGGSQLAAGLAERLKGIGSGNDPAVAQEAAAAAATGQGSGNALYAKGSAAMSDLLSRGAGAQEYAAKLPGLAGLSGAQSLRDLELKSQSDLASQAADVRSKIPDLVAQLRSANDAKASHLADARQQIGEYLQSRTDTANQNAANRRERATLAQMANETSNAKAQQDWNKFVISENDRNARAANAEQGRNTRAAAAAAAKGKSGGLSAGKQADIQTKAANDADTFYYGVQPKQHYDSASGKWIADPSTGTPGLDYPQAVQRLMAKYPSLGQQAAQALLDNFYAPGERGRPAAPPPKPSPDTGFRSVTIP